VLATFCVSRCGVSSHPLKTINPSILSPTLLQEHRALAAELVAKEALLADAVAQTLAWRARAADVVAAHAAADRVEE
jgi:hypothetical protein